MHSKKTIFLTGATGNMGSQTLRQLLERADRFRVRILVLPSEKDKRAIRKLAGRKDVEIIWGDLTRYDDVLAGVAGADQVLHVGGMVSPVADRFPERYGLVNVGGARNIVKAIKAQAEPDRVRLVYIGTVAETGSRNAPIHWGRTGDPIKISTFDDYAVSKTRAEAIIAESGLRQWVSLRQSGMAHTAMWKIFDPIMFHNPVNGVFEWSTDEDSGRLMANVCEDGVPDALWRGFYNIGGGAAWRLVNHEFMAAAAAVMGQDFRGMTQPNWIATRNFHGQWYSDSDRLEALVPFRRQTPGEFHRALAAAIPWYIKLAARIGKAAAKKRVRQLAEGEGGTLNWIANDDRAHIDAFFGSRDAWERLPDNWDDFPLEQPSHAPVELNHGYNETKDPADWSIADFRDAAAFRGGACLSQETAGAFVPVGWRCARGHEFGMTPNLMLKGGHWCPTCMVESACYPEAAAKSPFFAQVFLPKTSSEGFTAGRGIGP